METTCPPIPTLQEFAQLYHNGEYILVDVEDLKTGEYVLSTQPNWNYLICIKIGENNEEHLQFRFHHLMEHGFINERKAYINSVRGTNQEFLFFRKNFRKNFDKATAMIKNRINNNAIRDVSDRDVSDVMKNVLGNQDLTRHIGSFLEPTSRRGGRRKTRKTRKTKRKSTRRIVRKYKR